MKNIISKCLILILFLLSSLTFAQVGNGNEVHSIAAKKDISEIKKHIELTEVEESEVYLVLLDKNEYFLDNPDLSSIRRNWNVDLYIERIEQVLKNKLAIKKFKLLKINEEFLVSIGLNKTQENDN